LQAEQVNRPALSWFEEALGEPREKADAV